jgi:hypothetical protein
MILKTFEILKDKDEEGLEALPGLSEKNSSIF